MPGYDVVIKHLPMPGAGALTEEEFNTMRSETAFLTLPTWGGRKTFSYLHDGGLALQYGNNRHCRVSAECMAELQANHSGASVAVFGPEPSLDAWAKKHITRTRIASYLAPALVDLGLAERAGDRIKFL